MAELVDGDPGGEFRKLWPQQEDEVNDYPKKKKREMTVPPSDPVLPATVNERERVDGIGREKGIRFSIVWGFN